MIQTKFQEAKNQIQEADKLAWQNKAGDIASHHSSDRVCPSCGYCPTCGRSRNSQWPYYSNPYNPYPTWYYLNGQYTLTSDRYTPTTTVSSYQCEGEGL